MRKLAIFFTTLFFAITSFSSANAQLLDTFDDQISSSSWEVVNDLFDATNTQMSDIVGFQVLEDPNNINIGFIIIGLDTPIGSFEVYSLGSAGQFILYLGPADPLTSWTIDPTILTSAPLPEMSVEELIQFYEDLGISTTIMTIEDVQIFFDELQGSPPN
jgi:hypothetical protein